MERPAIVDAIINAHGAPGGPIEEIRAYISALEKDAARWQPIETAPTTQRVLMFSKDGMFIGCWGQFSKYNHPGFTHWMPLPAPPVDAALAAEKKGDA